MLQGKGIISIKPDHKLSVEHKWSEGKCKHVIRECPEGSKQTKLS